MTHSDYKFGKFKQRKQPVFLYGSHVTETGYSNVLGQSGMLEHFTFLPSLSSRHFFSAYLAWIRLQRHPKLSKYLIHKYHLVVWCISVTVQYTFPIFQKYFNLRPCFTFTFLHLKNISTPGWLACSLLKLGLCCLLD